MTALVIPPERLQATLAFDEPVNRVPGVKAARAKVLSGMGINSVRDLLTHFPRRYMDLTKVRTSATAQIGEQCTIAGVVRDVKLKKPKPRLQIVEIALADEDGILIASVFNRPYLARQIEPGMHLVFAGKVEFNYGFARMTNPYIEHVEDGEVRGRVVPVHPATSKLSAAQVRAVVKSALGITAGMIDPLPLSLREKRRLVGREQAICSIHFPRHMEEAMAARRRLAYEELLMLQLFMMMEDASSAVDGVAHAHKVDGAAVSSLRSSLPFQLSEDQSVAVKEILESLSENAVTKRMLLGDVGTGKTVVAAFGMAAAADSGSQAMLLAPTEVLAGQHVSSLGPLLGAAGVSVGLLTGSTTSEDREHLLDRFSNGTLDVLIGTHALLEPSVQAKDLSFVVIDEQQRFGVEQREVALSKGVGADALFMTATPIPRTLALTLFGGMELSYLRQRPKEGSGRSTKVLHSSQKGKAFDFALKALKAGRQVYVVCPLIGVSREETSNNSKGEEADEGSFHPDVFIEAEEDFDNAPLSAAEDEARFLQDRVFPDYNVGLLHGALPSERKLEVMDQFRSGDIDVLVSTTLIEVGVDVANATVMIVEDADRFGLSQLHQLRGRVGRGEQTGQVFLLSSTKQPEALKRLSALESSDDGFEIARFDLALRREGDILGNRQSGVSSLKLVNVIRDTELVEASHEDAQEILACDPGLSSPEHAALAREVRVTFKGEHSRMGG